MTLDLTPAFKLVQMMIGVIFLGAVFFILFRALKIDYVQIIKDRISGKKSPSGFLDGLKNTARNYGAPNKEHPCENPICDNNAGESGAIVRHKNGTRKIVCAECAAAYVKTGWIPEMGWGEEYNSALIGLGLGAALTTLIPKVLLSAPHIPDIAGTVLLRITVYLMGALIVAVILRRDDE